MTFVPKNRSIDPPARKRAAPVHPVAPSNNYDVGYARPPKASQFKQGTSGNPKGRPKGSKGVNTIVRDIMAEKVVVRTADGSKKVSRAEALVMKLIERAFSGQERSTTLLLQLYRASVPDDVFAETVQASDVAGDEAAMAVLRSLWRDEDQASEQREDGETIQ